MHCAIGKHHACISEEFKVIALLRSEIVVFTTPGRSGWYGVWSSFLPCSAGPA